MHSRFCLTPVVPVREGRVDPALPRELGGRPPAGVHAAAAHRRGLGARPGRRAAAAVEAPRWVEARLELQGVALSPGRRRLPLV